MASIDYYNDEEQWGNYQYVTLDEVINTYIASRTSDDYTISIPRFQILLQVRRGMRELYYDVVKEIRVIELQLSPSLKITLPPDFVNFVRISYVDENGQLNPMAVDHRMSIAEAYLQDSQYNLLFDSEGRVLTGTGVREPINPQTTEVTSEDFREYYYTDYSFIPNYDLSKNFDNGKYRIDKAKGVIEFGSAVVNKNIVLEYISDGLYTGSEGRPEAEIRVHKFAESALMDYIYNELIKRNRNVPSYEKQRAEKEYVKNKRKAKRRLNTIRYDEIMQIFKGQSKWIKGV